MNVIILIPLLFVAAWCYPYIPGHDFPWCAIKIGTGFNCPGCGLVRSIAMLVRGEFAVSLRQHPFGVLVAFWLLKIWCGAIYKRLFYETKGNN